MQRWGVSGRGTRMDGAVMRIAGLVLAAGLALSACTGANPDPEVSAGPTGDPTPTASASPSPSVPTKPERPEAMEREDAEGAAAAAEYFLSLYAYTKATGDTEEWDAMSHQTCGFCEMAKVHATEIAANQERYSGGGLSVDVTQMYLKDELTGIYPLDVRLSQAPFEIRDRAGERIESSDGEVLDRRVEMGRRGDKWIVVTVAPIPDGNS
ncbi:DUF6318 family protein [Promicromonospora alba]|uniref:DUF6318 family protein n=1 Tax=Promicromonospora alba TaxID=1616110 RepID=A0ABV9HPH7_9MICO